MPELTRTQFIDAVAQVQLPVNESGLQSDFEQPIHWRSLHLASLMAEMQKRGAPRPDVRALFAASTAAQVFEAFNSGDQT